MSLLAEEIVEEWLNRDGYFTIRGIRLGNDEIDLLAINKDGVCRHVEVQASVKPMSYITHGSSAAKRTKRELRDAAKKWVHKKFLMDKKANLKTSLHPGVWSHELVVHKLKYGKVEVPIIEELGVRVIKLDDILAELKRKHDFNATGKDLVDLINST